MNDLIVQVIQIFDPFTGGSIFYDNLRQFDFPCLLLKLCYLPKFPLSLQLLIDLFNVIALHWPLNTMFQLSHHGSLPHLLSEHVCLPHPHRDIAYSLLSLLFLRDIIQCLTHVISALLLELLSAIHVGHVCRIARGLQLLLRLLTW